jgi:hypothetical protein
MVLQILEEIVVANHTNICNISGKRNKGPEVSQYLTCLRILKKTAYLNNSGLGGRTVIKQVVNSWPLQTLTFSLSTKLENFQHK